jgi:threonine/homoserine/homoserine lactone efflux protein
VTGVTTARRGALINIPHPKLSLVSLASVPPFLAGDPTTATAEIALPGTVFMGMTFAVLLCGLSAATARAHMVDNPAVLRWVGVRLAAVFGALAARPAVERA